MSESKDLFYLERILPDPAMIFTAEYKSARELFGNAIFVFDTNALLVPFDTSQRNLEEIKSILINLKNENRLFIPARVAREFAKNRAKKLGDLFLSLRQLKSNLNSGTFTIENYPLLEGISDYTELKKSFSEIQKFIKKSRLSIETLEASILGWTWNDKVSLAYKDVFTSEVIFEAEIKNEQIQKELEFRINHKIAPGYKDKDKIDEGIGDLIIWYSLLEIGKKFKSNIIFISNDEKNDWFYKQDKISMYPKYELYDEFRRETNGKCFAILNFLDFLSLSNAKEDTLKEVKLSIEESKIDDTETINYQMGLKNLKIGLKIKHRKFGYGIIIKVHNDSKHQIIDVDFNENGIRKLMSDYAALHILDTYENSILLNQETT